MKHLIAILSLYTLLFAGRANATTYYVSPSGSDSNPGTIDKPFASWQKLSSVLRAGDIAYIRGGTYRSPKAMGHGNYPVDFRNLNGTASAHITVSAYPGEYPVLNLDNIVESVFMIGFYLGNCSYIDFKGLRITGLKQSTNPVQSLDGWRVDLCNQITFTQCEIDHMQGPGWRITQATPTSSVITYTNCDSHDNGDPLNTGGGVYGNADGFDANGGTVTYIGCRAWSNSDDGFDAFYSDAPVTYKNCWSFWNGFIPGTFTDPGGQADGDGFKWGNTTSDLRTTHLRTFTNCVAFQNKGWGFDQNVARCIAWFYNNTSYQNGFKNTSHGNGTGGGWAAGYNINPPVAIVLKNNISYNDATAVSNFSGLIQDHNTWNNLAASTASFASMDTTAVTGPRGADGSLPVLAFLHLAPGSNLIDKGVDVTLPFSGSVPDLGAFEYSTSSPTNQLPIADAGQPQVIVLPTSSVTLNGNASRDPDGTINSYNWSKISGPSPGIISTPTLVTTTVTSLVQGTYQFELAVTDDKGAIGKDTVTIAVNNANQPPVADAGQSQVIVLPTNLVTLNGNASRDPDGTINSYTWSKISGPSPGTISTPTLVTTSVTALVQGTYQFELTVTDDKGATGKDTVTITVNNANQLPVADAGQSQIIVLPTSSVTLDGTASRDPDGTINSYNWSKIAGPSSAAISTPTLMTTNVTALIQGTYQFELIVTDDKGVIGKDTVTITVNNANQSPVADAGQSQAIVLPTSSVTLDGSASRDPDGTINSYNWSKIAGPSSAAISTPTLMTTNVTALVQGTYQFELTVTDDKSATGKDTVTITVNNANQSPAADAGQSQVIVLPTSSVTLDGSASGDPDGTINSYNWSKITGPSSADISTPDLVATNVTTLVPGTYKFQLMVTDDQGAVGMDTVTITVKNANQSPVADAGQSQAIVLPTSSVTLDGSASGDPDGTINSYNWSEIEGPSPAVISTPDLVTTNVTTLVQGTYKFQLLVTDDQGAVGMDIVTVTVTNANRSPIAEAGQTQVIVLPINSAILDGSASGDPDGTVNSYSWSEISGPSSATISTPDLVTTNVTALVQGTYKFKLTVTDDQGATGMDIVVITVMNPNTGTNQSPVADAGQSQEIVLPTSSVTLDGSASGDPDGTVSSYDWSEIEGPSSALISTPDLVTTDVATLVQGIYKFQLIVTDDQGATEMDTVTITVNKGNQSPVADAGQLQGIVLPTSSVTLDGSASDDPDGTVNSYSWSEIAGPSSAFISTPDLVTTNVTALVQGTYQFQLIVTDDKGATGKDTVTITVNNANQSPVADAGQSQVIILPTSSVTLNASSSNDPDGTINSYNWSKISGPSPGTISTPTSVNTSVTALVQGTYQFQLIVTDDKGATGKDTVTITVNNANQSPVADAGQSQVIILPTSSVTLNASSSNDPDGTINSYNWSKISGPSSGTISTPTSVSTSVTSLVQGTYQFQLVVTDSKGATGKDTVTITVNANQSPVADAGQSQVIILPTSSVTLNGSASRDPDGTINSYNWSKISGPSSGTISTPTSVSTSVTSLVQGTYQFQLVVTDDKGATGKDTVTITVNVNQSPVADAGQSQVIILPTSSVTLNGSASNDPDGTINSYNWSKISGPSSGTISTPTSVSTSVTSLVQGTYQFQLVVTDSKGATGKDTVTITVNANQSPVADAGQAQVIILPTSSVTLNGSASRDPDGTINSFNWSKISGPSSGTISTPTQVTTNVTSLVQGTYQFQLFVTDNKGATGKDTVTITVNSAPTAYYFSSSTGNDSRTSAQAQNSLTPWKTLDKLNSIFSTLKPGDVIYFKRGDTFYGSINPTTSGTSSAAIKFAAYSTGNKPIITGLSDATGWTTVGTNIWESSTIPTGQASAMIVAINGTSYPMGRWPNATDTWGGFRKISSHSGSTSITDVSLTGTPNWRGATLVMRKNQYRMEKGTVTTHSGTTLTYSSTWNQTAVTDNYGYFIENSLSTLDKQNEWYYNSSTKKLDIYSTSTPSNVKISTITTLINASSRSYLSFENLNIQGSIGRMILVSSSSHISFTNCDLSNAGSDAIYGTNCSYLDVENCTITNSNHTAITLDQGASNTIVKNNTITSSAANPGMLDNYWLYAGVYVVGSNTTVEKNLVRKSGYLGIAFAKGNSVSIKNNFVDSSFLILDEGGAIYTVRGSDATVYTSRVIDGNIVTNMLAALNGKPGTQGAGAGIQMDDNSQGVTITNNSIANGAMYGILLSNAHEITVTNNTVYNCTSGAMAMVHDAGLNLIRNVNQTRNKFVMRTANTNSGTWSYQTSANDVLQFGSSDSNIIATPINDVNAFFTFDGSTNRHQTVAQWQSFSGKDPHSKKSPKTITTVNDLRFEYNATSSSKTVSLGKAYIDIAGTSYPSSITLAPYTSAVLIAGSLTAQSVATAEVIDETTLNEKPLLTIYPNPVTNNFILQLSNNHMGKMDVQVVNQAGAIVRSYIFNKDQVVNQITVPAHDLPSGVYFIHVQIGSWSDKRKIVKL